jgi:Ca2+/Na+ antiporter
MLNKILTFAAVAEAGTGLVLLVAPTLVVQFLLGMEAAGIGVVLGRCFGIALIALALACWPGRQRGDPDSPSVRGMLIYNLLVALYLAFLGSSQASGLLLWPAVVLHAVVALLLLRAWVTGRRTLATRS